MSILKRVSQAALEEPSVPDDIDATLRDDAGVDDDKLAEEPELMETAVRKGNAKRTRRRARQVAPPLSPRRTRARSRSRSVDVPEDVPAAPRTTRAKAKALAATTTAAAPPAALQPVPESQVFDEFVAHSDDDEVEMHEVEDDLQVSARSRGKSPWPGQTCISPCVDMRHNTATELHTSHSAEDMFTSRRLRSEEFNDSAIIDVSHDDPDDDESDDADLLAHVERLEVRGLPTLPTTASQNKKGDRDRDRHSSSEETFPSPGTRAGAEKKRLTQAAKDAPYVPPRGTRAASMIEKERARARQAAPTAVRRR